MDYAMYSDPDLNILFYQADAGCRGTVLSFVDLTAATTLSQAMCHDDKSAVHEW